MRLTTATASPVLLLLFLVLPNREAVAQDAAASESARFAPIEYLVGGTWTARGDFPGVGPYTVRRTYRWTLGRHFIEQHQIMELGGQQLETKGIIGWDAEKKALVAWGFGDDGGVVTSQASETTAGDIRFEGVRAGGFNAGPVRGTFKRLNDDEFVEIAEAKKGDAWSPMFTFRFTRTPAPPGDPGSIR